MNFLIKNKWEKKFEFNSIKYFNYNNQIHKNLNNIIIFRTYLLMKINIIIIKKFYKIKKSQNIIF
jgi:hypothetical protein